MSEFLGDVPEVKEWESLLFLLQKRIGRWHEVNAEGLIIGESRGIPIVKRYPDTEFDFFADDLQAQEAVLITQLEDLKRLSSGKYIIVHFKRSEIVRDYKLTWQEKIFGGAQENTTSPQYSITVSRPLENKEGWRENKTLSIVGDKAVITTEKYTPHEGTSEEAYFAKTIDLRFFENLLQDSPEETN